MLSLPARRAIAAPHLGAMNLLALLLVSMATLLPSATRSEPAAEMTPIDEITVVSQRVENELLRTPASVSVIDEERIRLAQPQLTLAESLDSVPGVFVQNRTNFAQDSRISIRGFGSRAQFGLRGLRLVVDDIPFTLPDGQGMLDSIDLSSATRLEVLRGPSAALYGPAAGGVLRITTEEGASPSRVAGRAAFGSYGYGDYGVQGGGLTGPTRAFGSLRYQEMGGYRSHAGMENILLNTKMAFELAPGAELGVLLNHLHAPKADDPGGLTAAEVQANRRQARAQNVQYDAGESMDSTTLGLALRKRFGEQDELLVRNYYTWRDFSNKLPFRFGGQRSFERLFVGGGVQHVHRCELWGRALRLSGGVDVDAQLDDRQWHENLDGQRGVKRLDQEEQVLSAGVYLQQELALTDAIDLNVALRYDHLDFELDDHFRGPGNTDESDDRNFDEFNFAVAAVWRPVPLFNPYGRVASSFETPTTTELASPPPPATGGFDDELDPEEAYSFELGARGDHAGRFFYELSLFHIRLHDEIVRFTDSSDNTFYRNAGRSKRTGVEVAIWGELLPGLSGRFHYTWSHFEYVRFRSLDFFAPRFDYDGNAQPGLPEHLVFSELAYRHDLGFFARWNVQYVAPRWADSANSVRDDSYVLSNLQAGWELSRGAWSVTPFIGLDNLFDEKYTDNLRINDQGGRYFEPAPEYHLHGGVSVSYRFER